MEGPLLRTEVISQSISEMAIITCGLMFFVERNGKGLAVASQGAQIK